MDFAKRPSRYAATFAENEELLRWLRQEEPEEVLEPDLPIIDTHHHLWDRRRTESWPFKQKAYSLSELLEDVHDGHNVVGTVLVEARSFYRSQGPAEFAPVGEVEYAQGVAAACDSGAYRVGKDKFCRACWGIQGTCDLRHPEVESVLLEMMRCRNFRGVRAEGPYDEAFKRGFRALRKHGLVFDRWHGPTPWNAAPTYDPEELGRLKALALEFPDVTIVLNHLGGLVGPMLAPEVVERWRADMKDLASSCSNVICKVGGIQKVKNSWGFEKRKTPIGSEELAELVYPWYAHAIECFGTSRCMFESNFPVEKECVSYRTLWNSFKRVCARMGLTEQAKREIFHDTAVRVYKLVPSPHQAAL